MGKVSYASKIMCLRKRGNVTKGQKGAFLGAFD